jgi:hypothetical protein
MLRESGATPLGSAAQLPNPAQRLTNKYRHFLTEERRQRVAGVLWSYVFHQKGLDPER